MTGQWVGFALLVYIAGVWLVCPWGTWRTAFLWPVVLAGQVWRVEIPYPLWLGITGSLCALAVARVFNFV